MIDDETKKLLGLKIQKLRKFKNLTQDVFCEAIGIEPSNLSKIENGKNYPSLPTFIKISEVLNISLDELLEIEHLKSEEQIEKEIIDIIKKQPSNKKQLLYRLIKMFQE